MPTPTGTGFFISSDGWFLTAAHVVAPDKKLRPDVAAAWLTKEGRVTSDAHVMIDNPRVEAVDFESDIALLKLDFETNRTKDWMRDLPGFPFIRVSSRLLDDGEPVYAFGYPLPEFEVLKTEWGFIGGSRLRPRTTSAIVSSTREYSEGPIPIDRPHMTYVVDKALNYGNSGGPIVAVETGLVHALCARFDPVGIPQSPDGKKSRLDP